MKSVIAINHPLLKVALTELRDKTTSSSKFRRALYRAGLYIGSEALKQVVTQSITVETPLTKTAGYEIPEGSVVLVPILRAGLGFVDPFLELIPNACVGHIGLSRDHVTLESREYYRNVPAFGGKDLFVLDPMLATGHSSVAALKMLLNDTAEKARSVSLVTLLAAPEGLEEVSKHFPNVTIFTGSIDEGLNEKGYIVPGLGDAGDRFFGSL